MPRLYHCSSLYGTRQGLVKKAKRQDISHLFRRKLAVLHNISPVSPLKGPHPEDGAQVLGQLPAGLDLLGALVVVYDGDHHLGHRLGRPPDEVQHGLPALLPGAGAGEAEVLLLVRPVEGDRHRIQPPGQLRGDVPVVDEAAVAVGVQPDGGQVGPAGGVELVADPEQIVGPAGGLPIAAKDNLGIGGEVMGQDLFQDGLLRGLLLEPQWLSSPARMLSVHS